MMKNLFFSLSALLIFSAAIAQKDLPYKTNFDSNDDKAGWTDYRMGTDKFYNWSFSTRTSGSLTHDYPVGASANDTTYDWMVSPALNLSSGASISLSVRGFALIGVTPEDYFGIWVSTGSADPADGDYSEVVDLTNFSISNSYKDTSVIDLKSVADDGHIAFVYRATQNWYTIAVDSVEISSSPANTSKQNTMSEARIMYNGNQATLYLSESGNTTYQVYNSSGQLLYEDQAKSALTPLNFKVQPRQLYFIQVRNQSDHRTLKWISH